MFYLVPVPKQFVDFSGVPYSCGSVTVYIHGTTDKAQIYSEAGSRVLLPNPCQLDSNGAWKCFVPADTPLDYIVQDRDGNVVVSYMNIVLPGLSIEGNATKEYVDAQNQLRDRNFARDYNPAQAYPVVGTYVMHEGRLHKSIIVIDEPEEWNAEHWAECNVTDELNDKIAAESQSRSQADSVLSESISSIAQSLADKKDKQNPYSVSGSSTKTVKSISQNANGEVTVEFEDISLPDRVPNVEITSEDNSIQVTETTDVGSNTKKFDLSVNIKDPLEYGQFRATNVTSNAQLNKVNGNLELNNYAIKLKKGNSYHFTVRGSYVANSAVNTNSTIHYIESISFNNIQVNVDNTITDAQFFEISYDVYKLSSDKNYNVAFSSIDGGKVSELCVEVHNLNGVSVNGQGGGGTTYSAGYGIDLTNDTISVNTDIIATKKSVDDVKTDLSNLTEVVNNHTTEIVQIKEDVNSIKVDVDYLKADPTWINITSKLGNYNNTQIVSNTGYMSISYSKKLALLIFGGWVTPSVSGDVVKLFSFNTDIVKFTEGEYFTRSGRNVLYVSVTPYIITSEFRRPYSITARDVTANKNIDFQFIVPLEISTDEFDAYLASH